MVTIYLGIGACHALVLLWVWLAVEPPAEPEWTFEATFWRVVVLLLIMLLWLPLWLIHFWENR